MAVPLTRLHLLVRGTVQSVGYRWFARRRAEALGLTGWVRNREDGSVEAEAQGPRQALERFVAELKAGPPAARVQSVEVRAREAAGDQSFEIRD